jgi:hypothetical protein
MPAPDDASLDPEAARVLSKVRRLMAISVAFTGLAIAAVLVVVGYRVYNAPKSAEPARDATASLPKGARVVAASAAEGRLIVTVEVDGQMRVLLFDLQTLQPRGTLSLQASP